MRWSARWRPAVAVGNTGVGVAVGVAVARNFIGWDPNGLEVTAIDSTTRNEDGTDIPTTVAALTPGMKVRVASGALTNDIYEYIGPQVTDSDPNKTVFRHSTSACSSTATPAFGNR